MIIYQKNNCVKELLPELISVDFPYCSTYSQSQFIIVLFLIERENKYSQFYYKLYNINNLDNPINNNDYCTEVKVEIPYIQANFDIDKYQKLFNKGIDLTNHLENFFHDMCFQNYEDDKDIVIKQRRKEYYQDPYKICLDNCKWVTPDYNYKRASCKCETQVHFLNRINVEYTDYNQYYIKGEDFYNTDINVFEHLKCFKYNFEDGKIFKNMGSYMIVLFFLLEIISMIVYGVMGIDSIKMYIIDFVKGNPPKNNNITTDSQEEKENEIDIDIGINDEENSKPNSRNNLIRRSNTNKRNKKQLFTNNFISVDNRDSKIKNKNRESKNIDLLIGRSNNLGNSTNKIIIYQKYQNNENDEIDDENEIKNIKASIKKSRLISSKMILQNSTKKEKPKDITFEKHQHIFTDYELNSMELYDAVIKDKRSFCYFYKLQMKSKQEFYRTFCINEPLFPFAIKIIIYIFNLTLNLVFNALFYTEDQIYEGIKSIGKDIGYIFLRAFYTFLVIKGIDYLINLIIKNSNYLRSLVYRRKREKELRVDAYKSLKHVRANFCLLFIFVIICNILFWIYISSFCYCYNGEQKELFGAFLVTQFYMEIYCILFGLYLTIFRYIGLKYKAVTFYKLSQTFLDN